MSTQIEAIRQEFKQACAVCRPSPELIDKIIDKHVASGVPSKNVLVVSLGYFGRGSTVKEAAENCVKAGASKRDRVSVIIADEEIRFVDALTVEYPKGEPTFQVDFTVKQLGSLIP